MDKCPADGGCLLRKNLDNFADPLDFLAKHYTVEGIINNLDNLSAFELKCACCIFGTVLQKMPQKRSFWKKLRMKR